MLTLLRTALCILLFAGAAVAGPPPKLVGNWKLVAVNTANGAVPKETLEQGEMLWMLAADGKFAASATQGKETRSSKGSWSVTGTQLTVTDGEHKQEMAFTIDATTLTVTNAAAKVTMQFRRQAGRAP